MDLRELQKNYLDNLRKVTEEKIRNRFVGTNSYFNRRRLGFQGWKKAETKEVSNYRSR